MTHTIDRCSQTSAVHRIPDGLEFDASSLTARAYTRPGDASYYCGRLSGRDAQQYSDDRYVIDYVVFSCSTPIAWRRTDGTWHVVEQKFSITTSTRHQSKLYLIRNVTTGRGAKVGV